MRPGGSLLLGYFEGPAGEDFSHAVSRAYRWDFSSLKVVLNEHGFVVVHNDSRHDPWSRPHGEIIASRQP